MAIIKCKMCGGDMALTEGESVAICEYCGTKQTVPTADNEKKMTLFSRANRLRLANEFDKAAGVYESIVAEFSEEAEAYWGLVLCRYGIEYVDDPATGKKVPTCHRSSFDSVMEDNDFEQACENAEATARRVYREEAKAIEEIRKGILEVSGKEEPYDIFICYKETDENGDRTLDSVIAQDVYDALTEKGYRVFFSRITLEDKLGTEYEPYIFAALNSAKIMLVFGTDYEYINSVWVKNEWSRFLSLIAAGQKKILIPCYKNIDAYDMPKEFAKLQAQDMGKVGATQDLLRGIEKITKGSSQESLNSTVEVTSVQQASGPSIVSLLERGNLALEDSDWEKAGELFDQVLNVAPKSAEAYLGVFMVENRINTWEMFSQAYINSLDRFESDKRIRRVRQFESEDLKVKFDLLNPMWEKEDERRKEEQKRCEKAAEEAARIKTENERKAIEEAERARRAEEHITRLKMASGFISAGKTYIAAVKSDGTVLTASYKKSLFGYNAGQNETWTWKDIIKVSCGSRHILGLKADGTVVTTTAGLDSKVVKKYDVSQWKNIVDIYAADNSSFGLRSDGVVLCAGENEDYRNEVRKWSPIAAMSANTTTCIGLSPDRIATGGILRDHIMYQVRLQNVVSVSAGRNLAAGLKEDGTVIYAAEKIFKVGGTEIFSVDNGVLNWNGVEKISVIGSDIVGWKADGTLVATGSTGKLFQLHSPNLEKTIIAIAGFDDGVVILNLDGTLTALSGNKSRKIDFTGWKLFHDIDEYTVPVIRPNLSLEKR